MTRKMKKNGIVLDVNTAGRLPNEIPSSEPSSTNENVGNRKVSVMADKQKFGYEQTLIYGQYRKDLGSFARFQAKRIKKHNKADFGNSEPKPRYRILECWIAVVRSWHWVVKKVGEDWIFLALLGIIMALLSFTMDYVIEKMQEAKIWLYQELSFSISLQYLSWVLYSILLITFAVGFTHLMSPQAIGSGIPEMKTILRGVVLKEFLTFRTLVSKVVGLCSSLGSTLPFGKEGPFVHIASIVATILGKLTSFKAVYENESRRSEMLAAACAVGVAGTFAAPIGGVLFSIEVTATYFAVRNYWRGFFGAVCGAVVFRLLAFWFKYEETLTALFKTNLKTDFPFDPVELLAFSFIGVACGLLGALFILCHRRIILFTRKHKKMSAFLQKNRFLYPGLIALLISSVTFPPGLGQFFCGQLTHRRAVDELFSNITWTAGQADDLDDEEILRHWNPPQTNIYVTLVLFIIMNFWMAAICNTLPIPAGVFVPVFTIGAAFGRLIGESMAAWFPNGLQSGDIVHKIVPGGYAVVGAASLSGSVTRTISTAVIVFELTGQISHVLPAVIAVLFANGVANLFQPSFYDSIIRLKRLPYLPNIVSSQSWSVYVEDIMVKDVKFVSFVSTFKELKDMLEATPYRTYPLVDTHDSMILLGSVKRFELERILWVHLSQEQKVFMSENEDEGLHSVVSTPGSSRPPTPPPRVEIIPPTPTGNTKPRFMVTKVDETNRQANGAQPPAIKTPKFKMSRSSSQSSIEELSEQELERRQYHTWNPPLRSILKNKTSNGHSPIEHAKPLPKASSLSDLEVGINQHFRKLSSHHADSIVEDIPFVINKNSFLKKVKLPPEPVKVKNLPANKEMKRSPKEQEEWEQDQLSKTVEWEGCQIDPAPFQLVERTSLHKVHSLFSLLGLNHAYVTNTGRLVGVVALKELRHAIQGHIDAEAERKKKHSHSTLETTEVNQYDSEDDILDDPQHLEVMYPKEPDGYTLVNRFNNDGKLKYQPESDTDV
ncbi:chloride channel protein 2-like isoform X3 [Mya arenaria]|uniref:chloride channel protein 2-like isoform X3 n=1 Tax=Mya arenaria TaxID=6604 RepID=UPI0022E911C8|nr:chloride channel protein 2-like isoform X3 [Mya arenaria]